MGRQHIISMIVVVAAASGTNGEPFSSLKLLSELSEILIIPNFQEIVIIQVSHWIKTITHFHIATGINICVLPSALGRSFLNKTFEAVIPL